MNDPTYASTNAIPRAIIDKWGQIPPQEHLTVHMTRSDLDGLFVTFHHLILAQTTLQEALIAYSNGQLDAANASMQASRRSSEESANALRGLFNSLMSSAILNRDGQK